MDNKMVVCVLTMLLLGAPGVVSGQIVCQAGQAICGDTCYNPAMGFTCTSNVLCGPGQAACGNSCYSPAFGETCSGDNRAGGIVCPSGFLACGTSCYNPAAGQTCNVTAQARREQGILTYPRR